MENDKEITLFKPKTGRDLRIQYPELYSVPEFKVLRSAREMLFVWYWSNPTSPVPAELPYKKKLELCFKESEWKPTNDIIRQLEENVWPDDLRLACDRMTKFEASLRNKARKVYKEIFTNFEKLVQVSDDDFRTTDKDGNSGIDFAARAQYVTAAKNIAAEIPNIIKKMEEGFGTDEEDVNGTRTTEKAIDTWHKSRQ